MLVVAANAMSVEEEFAELLNLLEKHGISPDPEQNLNLIAVKGRNLEGSYVKTTLDDLVDGSICDIRYKLGPIRDFLAKANSHTFNEIFHWAARNYWGRCRKDYPRKLKKAISSVYQRDIPMLEILSNDLSNSYGRASIRDISRLYNRGDIIKETIPHSIKTLGADLVLDSKKMREIHLVKDSRIIGRDLKNFCPLIYVKSRELIEELKHIISLAGKGDTKKIFQEFGDSFRQNIFKYKYCEDFVRCSTSSDMIREINKKIVEQSITTEEKVFSALVFPDWNME